MNFFFSVCAVRWGLRSRSVRGNYIPGLRTRTYGLFKLLCTRRKAIRPGSETASQQNRKGNLIGG